MMSLHKLTAGDGYTYLTRQVAAADGTDRGRADLAAYYTEKGERAGTWLGAGLAGVAGVEAGQVVTEAQMIALFGEGRHPDADAIEAAVIARGGTATDALAASALGMRFARYDATPSPFLVELSRRYRAWNLEHGRPRDGAVPQQERSRIRSEVARETFAQEYSRAPLNDRELAGHVARSSRPARQAVAGYDLTFSPVKSVSTLWAIADPATSERIEAAHEAAVKDTIGWLEREVAYTRVGPQGVRQIDVTGLVATVFVHRDSRAGDPDLHTHVAVSNKVQSADGRWLALDGAVLHRAVVAASERYNTRLEKEVAERLGVAFTPVTAKAREAKRVVREVVGVPEKLMTAWSKRRVEIDIARTELAADFQTAHGRPPTPKEAVELAQQATLATREAKHEPRSLGQQRATWRAQAEDVLGGSRAVAAMLAGVTSSPAGPRPGAGSRRGSGLSEQQVSDLAARALYTVQISRARFQWTHVYAEVSRLVRGLDLPIEHLDRSVDTVVARALSQTHAVAIIPPEFAAGRAQHGRPDAAAEPAETETETEPAETETAEAVVEPELLRRADGQSVYTPAKSQLYTTAAVLAAEAYLVDTARVTDGRTVDDATLGLALLEEAANGITLNPGQVQLVTEMVTSGARLQLALAPAGSGKTTAMSVLAKAWTDSGGQVLGLAPSAAAAKELGTATGVRADTLAKLTHSLREEVEMPDWVAQIGPQTLVVIDEAGMAGTIELATAVRYVTARGGSVRLVGDDQQLAAISAGGVLRDIAEEVGAVTLSELMRFSDPAEGAATLALRAGDPEALGFYLDRDRVHVADEATVADLVYAAWTTDTAAGKSSLMLAYSNEVVAGLNARARADRLAAGGGAAGREAVLGSGLAASEGDLVVTRRNDRRLTLTATDWVKNGDRFTVTQVHPGGAVTVRHLATARTITLPAEYVAEWVDLGYACTFHGAQGATVDTCHSALSGGENRQLLYVGMTRGRDANHAYLSTAGDGEEHAMIRPERIAPPTAGEALAAVIAADGSQRSARTEIREQHDPAVLLGRSAPRYVDALGVAATDLLGPERTARLDAVAEQGLPGLTGEPAWDALRGHLALIALHGIDPGQALADAVAAREIDTALDRAAVLHWRVTGAHPGPVGPLPWLPGIPHQLADHSQWGPYLAARAALVITRAGQVREAARALAPDQAPRWAHPLLAERDLVGDVMVWRAVTGVTDRNDQGSTLGGPHPAVAARRHQQGLRARVDAVLALAGAGATGPAWRALLEAIDPRILTDPYGAVLARRLDLAAAGGFDVPALLAAAGARGPLPDEHPAAALWYRLAPTLVPSAALTATSGSGAARLRPPWCDLLIETLPEGLGVTVMADPYWPAVVAAVHTAGTHGAPPERVIPDAVALIRSDRIGHPGGVPVAELAIVLAWRIADLTQPPATDPSGGTGGGEGVDPAAPDEYEILDQEREQFLRDLAQEHDHPTSATTEADVTADGQVPDSTVGAVGRPAAPEEDVPPGPDQAPAEPDAIDPAEPDAIDPAEPDAIDPAETDAIDPAVTAEDLEPAAATSPARILALNTAAMDFYAAQYTDSAAAAYLTGRLGTDLATGPDGGRFAIGYAPPGWTTLIEHLKTTDTISATDAELVDAGLARWTRRGTTIDLFRDRLIFGLHNPDHELIGFIGRAAPHPTPDSGPGNGGPKYLNTPETAVFSKGALLFGAAETADLRRAGAAYVRVEGPLDAIAITLAGHGNHVGVAPLGTALTEAQVDLLTAPGPGSRVLVATDNDPAGRQAAEADYWKLVARGVDPRALPIPGANDPAELLARDPDALATVLAVGEHAPSLAQALIDTRITAWAADLSHHWVHARIGAARACASVIAALPAEQWDEQVAYAAGRIGPDQPVQLVWTEVIAAAIDWDPAVGANPDADTASIARLAELLDRLQATSTTSTHQLERLAAITTVTESLRPPPGVDDEAAQRAAGEADRERRDRAHRHDRPAATPDGPRLR